MVRRRSRLVVVLVGVATLAALVFNVARAPLANAANPNAVAASDARGDTDPTPEPRADLTDVSIAYGPSTITVALHVVTATDPASQKVLAAWELDLNNDGTPEFGVGYDSGGAGVVRISDNAPMCDASPAWNPNGLYYATFPSSCIGSPPNVWVSAFFGYFSQPGNFDSAITDSAPDTGFVGPVGPPRSVDTQGLVVDDWGGLHPYHEGAGTRPTYSGGPYWPGQDVARGVAAIPGAGGVVVDDWGGLHPFSINGSATPGAPHGGPYWPGQNVVRGVAVLPNGGGGYVLDDWGGLHPFALGNGTAPPAANNVAFWRGMDVARGVVIRGDGLGGYTVDLWGGVHPFGIGNNAPPAAPTGGPYWVGQDVARGITLLTDGSGGFIGDNWGGLHGFDLSGQNSPTSPGDGPYWPGANVAWGPTTVGALVTPTTTTSTSSTSTSSTSSTTSTTSGSSSTSSSSTTSTSSLLPIGP